MTHNKSEYWENRRAGIRGQGEYATVARPSKDTDSQPQHMFSVRGRLTYLNRKQDRDRKLHQPSHPIFTKKFKDRNKRIARLINTGA